MEGQPYIVSCEWPVMIDRCKSLRANKYAPVPSLPTAVLALRINPFLSYFRGAAGFRVHAGRLSCDTKKRKHGSTCPQATEKRGMLPHRGRNAVALHSRCVIVARNDTIN